MHKSRVFEGLGSLSDPDPSSSSGPDVQDDPTTEHLGTRRIESKVATTSVGVGGSVVGWLVGFFVGY